MTAAAGYFGAEVFGLVDHPVGEASGLAVAICGPFGLEGMAAYRPLREWARALAADGHLVLRIDLPGCGDSPGSADDGDVLTRWQQAVLDAAAALRQQPGISRVAMLGVGLGGVLALNLAREAQIDDVVAWGVPTSGRRLVRELQAFAAFEKVPHVGDDALVAGGYVMANRTVAALSQIDLTRWDEDALAGRRVLLLGRGDPQPDARLREALTAAGAEVSAVDGREFTGMTGDAAHARTPVKTIATVGAWLAERASAGAAVDAPALLRAASTFAVDGAVIREQPTLLNLADGGTLFGVHAGPVDAGGDDLLLFLNAGALNRTGPNGMWVTMARRWAGRGLPSLRIDLAGIGESDGDSAALDQDAGFYEPHYIEQVLALLDTIEHRWGARRVAIVGLCSGAYLGLQAAALDDRVASVVMMNPRALVWDSHLVYRRDVRRVAKLARPETWRTLPRRRREARAALTAVRAGGLGRKQDLVSATDMLFDQVQERGASVVLVFSGDEPLDRELTAEGRWAQLDRWPAFQHQRLAEQPETHTLRPLTLQARAHELADRELTAFRS